MKNQNLQQISNNVRKTIIEAVYRAGSGHPGGSLSAADIVTALYFAEMNVDPLKTDCSNRDRFILSKGHAAPVLYSVLAEKGYFSKEEVLSLRKLGSKFQGHPCRDKVPGVDMSTGSLGQGISVAVGMALTDKLDKKERRVYTLLGDGELQEGIVWEALMAASHYRLNKLTAIVDWNGLQIDGENDDVMTVKPIDEKFKAFGWDIVVIDGHNFDDIKRGLKQAREVNDKPTVIIAKTYKGKGVSFMENQASWHGKAPDEKQFKEALKELGGDN